MSHAAGAPTRITNPKIALIQFCLSPPKTDIDQNVVVKDYSAMDRIMKEERKYIANLISKIVKSGANVLLVQKSILRDAVSDLALHFLAKKGIIVIKDIERDEVAFICKTVGCTPVAHID
jgi:T-complex protein 1 subunit delta